MAEIELLSAMIPALKIGIYLGVLILSFLLGVVYKVKGYATGLKIMSIGFMLAAVVEFLHIMHEAHETIFIFLANEEVVEFLIHLAFLISGIGLLWYLSNLKKNIKVYK